MVMRKKWTLGWLIIAFFVVFAIGAALVSYEAMRVWPWISDFPLP